MFSASPSVCLFHMEEIKSLSQDNRHEFRAGDGYLLLLSVASAILICQLWHTAVGELSSDEAWLLNLNNGVN